jgi:hypothetical protein
MRELHPRFRYHTGDWLTRHMVIMHCQVMSRSFADLGADPDLEIYKHYMEKQENKLQKVADQALKKCRIGPPGQLVLPGPKVSVSAPHFQQSDALESQAPHKPRSVTPRKRRAAADVGLPFHTDLLSC